MEEDDVGSPIYKALKRIKDLVCKRGNLSEIHNIIILYNASNEWRFDMNTKNSRIGGICMLAEACSHGQLEYVEWMLTEKCDPWITDNSKETVSHMAISRSVSYEDKYGDRDKDPPNSALGVIMTLFYHVEGLEKKMKWNLEKKIMTLRLQADTLGEELLPTEEREKRVLDLENKIKQGTYKFKKKIWEKRNAWHRTPLDYAARKGGSEVLKFFISKGAKVNGPLFDTQFGEILEADRRTFTKRPNPDPVDRSGSMYTRLGTSLLHQAIEFGNNDAFEILMQDGAHTHIYDDRGQTPLMCAIVHENYDVIERLIASPGMNVSQVHGRAFEYINQVGSWPVHLERYTTATQFILRDTPQEQNSGWNILHVIVAAELKNAEIFAGYHPTDELLGVIRMLLDAGADAGMKTENGQTPREMAESNGNATIAAMFKEWEDTKTLAFAMGNHERLGEKSHIRTLDPELVKMIRDIET